MRRIKVAHQMYSYLPVTQNWVYTQLRCNQSCDHTVVSLTEENPTMFPWGARFTAYSPSTIAGRVRLFLARRWIMQPDHFFASILKTIRPDVVHGHFAHESCRILALARSLGIPLVTTFYGIDVDKLARRRFWKRQYQKLFKFGSRFIVEGPFMGKQLAAIGCPEEKISIIPIGIDRAVYDKRKGGKASVESGSRLHVLFTGLHREKKGAVDAVISFCKAAQNNERLMLHIVGDGRYRSPAENILKTYGLFDRAVFHGYLPFDKYCEVLAASDMVIVPSILAGDGDCEGGAPVVCIEAQAAGKPVVATRHCDIPYVVKHGETGFLSAEHDTASMAHDLQVLGENPSLRRRMGEAGQVHAMLQHDSYRLAEQISAAYCSVIDGGKGGAGACQ